MLAKQAVAAALVVVLAGCAGLQPAGRNAPEPIPEARTAPVQRPQPAPPIQPAASSPVIEAAPLPPPTAAPTPAPASPSLVAPAPSVAAPAVALPPPPPPPVNNDDVTVTAPVERQVTPPPGDPRSQAERREDIQRWDHCVMQMQAAGDSDPTRPSLESPEDVCSRSLGMVNRNAVPTSRLQRRR